MQSLDVLHSMSNKTTCVLGHNHNIMATTIATSGNLLF